MNTFKETSIDEMSNGSFGSFGSFGSLAPSERQLCNKTFTDQVAFSDWPSILQQAISMTETPAQADMMVLGTLTALSAAAPNVWFNYSGERIYAPMYVEVVAPPSSGKGELKACTQLVGPIQDALEAANREAQNQYRAQLAQYQATHKRGDEADAPKEPPYRTLFLPANSTATACYQQLAENGGTGLIFETETDTLSQALGSDYGNFSDGLRKAWHHETISYLRRKDRERVFIRTPKLAVLLSCTPDQVAALTPSPDNGLFSRFLFYTLQQNTAWRSVRYHADYVLADKYREAGERYYPLYRALAARKDNPAVFFLTAAQMDTVDQFFAALHEEMGQLYGPDLIATVRRLAIDVYRIALVLTLLRLADTSLTAPTVPDNITCADTDFHTAMTIAEVLIEHSIAVYANLLPTQKRVPVGMSTNLSQQELEFYAALPDAFDTATYLALAQRLRIPERTAYRLLGKLAAPLCLIERLKHGSYCKRLPSA